MTRPVALAMVTAVLLSGCAGATGTDPADVGDARAPDAAPVAASATPTAAPSESITLGDAQPPTAPRAAVLSDGSRWTLSQLWEDGQPTTPESPVPAIVFDGGLDPVGDGDGRLIILTECGRLSAWVTIDNHVMSIHGDVVDPDGCRSAAGDDARRLLEELAEPLTIAIDDTTMTLNDTSGEPRLVFTTTRPAPLPTPPEVAVPGDWVCEHTEIPDGDRDQVGDRDTAALLLEPSLPAALRTEQLAVTLDGREVGRLEVTESGPRRTVAVVAYEYCLPPTIDPSPAPESDGPYGSWILANPNDLDQPADTTTTLELTPTQASGSTACNDYWASTAADVEGRFRVSGLVRNEVLCGEPYQSAEQRLADALDQVDRWEVTHDGRLLLHGAASVLEFSANG